MPEFGLGGTRLTVYRGEEADKFVLIAGEVIKNWAARRLGGTVITANIVAWEPHRRRMWEIVENLHRAELTELERAEQTVELIKLRGAASAKRTKSRTRPTNRRNLRQFPRVVAARRAASEAQPENSASARMMLTAP